MSQTLHGPSGELRGIITESGDWLLLTDKAGKLMGRYSKSQDKTYSREGHYMGTGNVLAMLIVPE